MGFVSLMLRGFGFAPRHLNRCAAFVKYMFEEEKLNPPETTGNLFTVGQIALATFIGAPIAGCLLLAQNYRYLGKAGSAWLTLILGFVSTIILLFIGFLLPEKFPSFVLPAAYIFGMRQIVGNLQGDVIAAQEEQGKKGSWAITVGVGIGCLVLILALIFGGVILFIPK
ncbi:hypothetical protein BH10ACI1_BH10ACI1_16070 [soil metagenome]